MRALTLTATLWLATLAGCKVMSEATDIMAIQMALASVFEEPALQVQPTPEGALVIFVPETSPKASLPEEERAAVARKMAEHVRDYYSGYPKLTGIGVAFVKRTGLTGASVSDAGYMFSAAELGPAQPRPKKP